MTIFRKSAAVLFALVFILTGLAAMLAFNLERKAFNPEMYQQVFATQRFYEKFPALLAEGLSSSVPSKELPSALQSLSAKNWENFINVLLPPETLKAMGDNALISLFDYLDYRSESAKISLLPLKESLTSDTGVQAVVALMQSQPDCTLAQVAQMTVSMINGEQFVLCNPPPELVNLAIPVIQTQLQLTAQVIPDSVLLLNPTEEAGQKDLRRQLKAARLFMSLCPLIPMFFLFLMTVLVVRSLYDWLSWWGVPFLVTGLLAFLSGLAGSPVLGKFLLDAFEKRLPNVLHPILFDQGQDLVLAIMDKLVQPIQTQGLILTGIGLVMTLIALAMRRFSQKSSENS